MKTQSNPENFLHKNRLQEYTQRLALPLPSYQTINEGSQHAPQFRSTVVVDGAAYKSPYTCSTKKAAEQVVAQHALNEIEISTSLIIDDMSFCKSILIEYATKMELEKPTYETTQAEGLLPTFFSSVTFAGKIYAGGLGKNKKEAEQMAARAAIESILGDHTTENIMRQIVKSKHRLYAAMHQVNEPYSVQDRNVALGGYGGYNPSNSAVEGSLADIARVHSIPPESKRIKRNTCETSSGSIVNGIYIPTLPPPAGVTANISGSVYGPLSHFHSSQPTQLNYPIPLVGMPLLPINNQSMVAECSTKRSKKKKRSSSN